MAEFCNNCAHRLGMRADSTPLLCEGCGKYFERKNNIALWSVAIIVLIVIVLYNVF